MPEIEKKEPGRPDVKQRERGDIRQRNQPIEKRRDETTTPKPAQDRPPARRGDDSPWMGGG